MASSPLVHWFFSFSLSTLMTFILFWRLLMMCWCIPSLAIVVSSRSSNLWEKSSRIKSWEILTSSSLSSNNLIVTSFLFRYSYPPSVDGRVRLSIYASDQIAFYLRIMSISSFSSSMRVDCLSMLCLSGYSRHHQAFSRMTVAYLRKMKVECRSMVGRMPCYVCVTSFWVHSWR